MKIRKRNSPNPRQEMKCIGLNSSILLSFFMLFFFIEYTYAQVHVELKDNPRYIKNIDQLWQLKANNLGSRQETVILSIELSDSAKQLLYAGNSRQQILPPGLRILNQSLCMPIENEQMETGVFPLVPGIYFFQFKLMDAGTNQLLFAGAITLDTRETKNGLAAWTQNKVRLSGTASILGQQSDYSGINTTVPGNYTRIALNPTLTVLDIPIGLNYLYSTESNSNRQAINQFSVQFDAYQYRANLEAKLMDKVKTIQDFKNPGDLKKLDSYQKLLKKKPSQALDKAQAKMGGKANLNEIESKINAARNVDDLLQNPDMLKKLDELNRISGKYHIEKETDIDKLGEQLSGEEKEKLKQLFAVKRQQESLLQKKQEADALQKKYKKMLQLKEKMDRIDRGELGSALKSKVNLSEGLKQFGMMGPGTRIMGSVQTLAIGTTFPFFSEQTLNGLRVDGFQLEMNPGILYFNFVKGQSAHKAFESTFSQSQFTQDQNLEALKAGIGKKDATHLFFTGIKIKDVNDTSQHPPGVVFQPVENYVGGTDLQLSFFQKTVVIGAEANGSLYTPNQNAAPLFTDGKYETGKNLPYEKELLGLMNSSSKIGYAYQVFSNLLLNKNSTNILAKTSYIDNAYYTLGNAYLLRDRQCLQLNASQTLFSNKFSIAAYYEENVNGLQPFSTLYKTSFTRYGGSIRINSKTMVLMFSYAPYFQSVSSLTDSNSFTNTGEMISSDLLLKYKFSKRVQVQTKFGNTYQKLSGQTESLISSFNFMQSINSPLFGLQLNATYSPDQNIGGIKRTVITGNINATLKLFKIWSNTLGYIHYECQGLELKSGMYYQVQIPIGSHILFDIRLNKNVYSNELFSQSNFSEAYLRYGLKIQL